MILNLKFRATISEEEREYHNNKTLRRRSQNAKVTSEDEHNGPLIQDSQKLPTVANNFSASRGAILAAKLPPSERHLRSILNIFVKNSFILLLLLLPKWNPKYCFCLSGSHMRIIFNCPTIILKVEKRLISIPLMEIMNASILEGAYPNKMKY